MSAFGSASRLVQFVFRDLAKKAVGGQDSVYMNQTLAIRLSLFILCCFVERPGGHRHNPNHLYKVFSTLLSRGRSPALCRGFFLCKIDRPLFLNTLGAF